jgi:hypothetical protein
MALVAMHKQQWLLFLERLSKLNGLKVYTTRKLFTESAKHSDEKVTDGNFIISTSYHFLSGK